MSLSAVPKRAQALLCQQLHADPFRRATSSQHRCRKVGKAKPLPLGELNTDLNEPFGGSSSMTHGAMKTHRSSEIQDQLL